MNKEAFTNQFTLKGKHILITGASSGIGKECAIRCSQMGANITIIARNIDRLNETYNSLEARKNLMFSKDITEFNSIKIIVDESVNKIGKIDGFIHAAGIEKTLLLKQHKIEDFTTMMHINAFAGFEFARIISLKKNISATSGSFVFISSILGLVGNSGVIGYSASKGALISACKSMSIELSKRNIRVNTISPGHIKDTRIWDEMSLGEEEWFNIEKEYPLGLGKSTDVANCAIFLLSDASKWITGTNLIVDGGYCAK